jgi:gluconokinase
MFDRESFSWNAAALQSAADLQPAQLPELYDACAPESSLPLLSSCLLAPHLPPHARVLPPISDGAAANLGAGCVDNTCACLTVGTSIALRTVVKSSVPPAISSSCGLWSYHLHGDLWLVGGALSDGGNLVAWLLKTMKFDLESWESEVAAMSPAAHGLVVLPFASGERSTGYRGDASFHVSGARTSSSPVHVMRATMEAVALRARALWQRMLPFMQTDACVIASGGALMTSKCWARMFSDAMGVPVTVCGENKEASIMGIVSQCTTYVQNSASASGAQPSLSSKQQLAPCVSNASVAAALCRYTSFQGLSPSVSTSDDPRTLQIEVLQPDAASHALYASALLRQEELYSAIYGERRI